MGGKKKGMLLLQFSHRCLVASLFSLFSNSKSDALSPGQGNPRFTAIANDKNVGQPRGKAVATGVPHMHTERSRMSFPVGGHTNMTDAGSTNHHTDIACVEFDKVDYLASP